MATPAESCSFVTVLFESPGMIWRKSNMVYPDRGTAPSPNREMPEEVKKDYEEAATIVSRSPRGAAALLRLAIKKLCTHLEEPGEYRSTSSWSFVRPRRLRACRFRDMSSLARSRPSYRRSSPQTSRGVLSIRNPGTRGRLPARLLVY